MTRNVIDAILRFAGSAGALQRCERGATTPGFGLIAAALLTGGTAGWTSMPQSASSEAVEAPQQVACKVPARPANKWLNKEQLARSEGRGRCSNVRTHPAAATTQPSLETSSR